MGLAQSTRRLVYANRGERLNPVARGPVSNGVGWWRWRPREQLRGNYILDDAGM